MPLKLILNKAKGIDSLIAINSLSLATFPLFIALLYLYRKGGQLSKCVRGCII